jgi:hypothetical protein
LGRPTSLEHPQFASDEHRPSPFDIRCRDASADAKHLVAVVSERLATGVEDDRTAGRADEVLRD